MVIKLEDLRNSPYNDDYDEDKGFHRILFRPSFAVQARELTQLQTVFQKQIERMGRHFFEEGAMVIPGNVTFDNNYYFVKVIASTAPVFDVSSGATYLEDEQAIIANVLNKVLVGSTTNVKAQVVNYLTQNSLGEVFLFVKYKESGGTNRDQKFFAESETLTVDGTAITFEVVSANATGKGTGATISRGVYFTKGFYVLVDNQSIVVDAENTNVSTRIGLNVVIDDIEAEEDESLFDNSQGTTNASAPGANRLKITLELATKAIDTISDPEENENFIELIRLNRGLPVKRPNRTNYSLIKNELARRTYDESGDYTVTPFIMTVREFLNEDDNNGVYVAEDFVRPSPSEALAVGQEIFGLNTTHAFGTGFLPGADDDEFFDAARAKIVYVLDPGKAFVRGYKIETLGQTFVNANKARDVETRENDVVRPLLGSYIRVNNLKGQPRLGYTVINEDSFGKVYLKDRPRSSPDFLNASSNIGTANCLFMEFNSGTPNAENAVYKLYLFDIKMNVGETFESVQGIYQDPTDTTLNPTGLTNGAFFECDTVLVEEPFFGTTVSTSGAVAAGDTATLTGQNSFWRSVDYQRLNRDASLKVVDTLGVEKYVYVVNPPLNNEKLTVTFPEGGTLTNSPVTRVYAVLEGQASQALLFTMPKGFIQTITDETNYTVQKQFFTTTNASGEADIDAESFEVFEEYEEISWIICEKDSGDFLRVFPSQVTFPLAFNDARASFTGLPANTEIIISAPVRKTQHPASQQKTKTERLGTFIDTGNKSPWVIVTSGQKDLREVSLVQTDVIRVTAIYMSADFATAPTNANVNILDRYELDDGQRDMFYDIAKIRLKKRAQPPTGNIAVVFDFFEHSIEGTYFSVDSYINVNYADIPVYQSKESSQDFPLSDVLDFRPTKNTQGEFNNANSGSITYMPDGNIIVTYSHYLHRRDKVYLNSSGQFLVSEGTPAVKPIAPSDPINGMVTYEVDIRAFTKKTKDVFLRFRDNRRYTMKDIGKIDKRVSNLEYYTSLSLLEKDAADLDIKDSAGNDRFKNGFIVDSFAGHGIGDTLNEDYVCAVDRASQELRPPFKEEMIRLRESKGPALDLAGFDLADTNSRSVNGYVRIGDLIMLPYTEVDGINQGAATTRINVNPYNVTNFIGIITLDSPTDEWKDTEQLPEKIVEIDNGALDAFTEFTQGLGTLWGEWQEVDRTLGEPQTEVLYENQQIFPGPAFHIDQEGNPEAWGNEALTYMQTKANAGQEIRRLERLRKILKGRLLKADTKRAEKRISQQIKTINGEIKEVKDIRDGLVPPDANNFPRQTTTFTKTTTPVDIRQTREGIKFTAKPGERIEKQIGNNVVDVSFSEFIRPQFLFFSGKLFKPNTRLFVFFDNQDVTDLCLPLNMAQGILPPQEYLNQVQNTAPSNVQLIQSGGETFYYAIGEGSVLTPSLVSIGETLPDTTIATAADDYPLITDETGFISGVLYIPPGLFRTGRRVFKLTDDIDNNDTDALSVGTTFFEARGLIEKREEQIVTTRSVEIGHEFIKTGPGTERTISGDPQVEYKFDQTCWTDPLAQSVLFNDEGGTFITAVDLYFATKPGATDPQIPVQIEIRETIAGLPGQKVVPFSRISKNPSEVSTNVVEGAIVNETQDTVGTLTVNNAVTSTVTEFTNFTAANFKETRFEFETPVYLEQGKEYAIVILANTQDYELWIATKGERNVGTRIPVTQQAYEGVFFKSSNASTWTPDQESDLAFRLHKAQFDISASPIVTLVNDDLPYKRLPSNPFKVVAGSNIIKVNHPCHGIRNKDSIPNPRVKFIGVSGTVGGIPAASINNDPFDAEDYHEVTVLDLNNYYIEIKDSSGNPVDATITSYAAGGTRIFATWDAQMDVMVPSIAELNFDDTQILYNYRVTSGDGVHDGQHAAYSLPDTNDYFSFSLGEQIEFLSPKLVGGIANESNGATTPVVSAPSVTNSKTLFIQCTLSSTNQNVTPIIDLARTNVIAVGNIVDDPGLASPYLSIVEPVDISLPTLTDSGITGTTTVSSSTIVTSGTPSTLFNVGGYVNVVSGGNSYLRKIVSISDPNIVVDKPFAVALAGAVLETSASTLYQIGEELIALASSVDAEFEQATNSIYVTDDNVGAQLSELAPGDLVKVTGSVSNGDFFARLTRVTGLGAGSFQFFLDTNDISLVDETAVGSITVERVVDAITTTDAILAEAINSLIESGIYINLVGTTKNDGTYEITSFEYDPVAPKLTMYVDYDIDAETIGSPGITLTFIDDFFGAETPSGGTSAAKYVTRRMVLANPSTALNVRFSASVQEGSSVDVYAKFLRVDDNRQFSDIRYEELISTNNPEVSPNDRTFSEYQFELDKLPPFMAVALKIHLNSNDSTKVPKVRDLMVVALDE